MKNFSTEQGCSACGSTGQGMTCLHHLMTQKSYPEFQYSSWNLIPVCQKHHNEFHSKGTKYMAETYPGVMEWLIENNWKLGEFLGKYYHPRAQKDYRED